MPGETPRIEWRELSPSEWARHPLNRFRGVLLALILVHMAALFGVVVILAAVVTGSQGVPLYPTLWANLLAAFAAGLQTIVFLTGVGFRWRYTPEASLATALIARWVQIWIDVETWPNDAFLLVEYEFSLVFWALVIGYLYLSRRANVVFRRRERVRVDGD
ncbi:MAG: hypothetical protein AAF661_03050 [Pseudomonadota bacterium]